MKKENQVLALFGGLVYGFVYVKRPATLWLATDLRLCKCKFISTRKIYSED